MSPSPIPCLTLFTFLVISVQLFLSIPFGAKMEDGKKRAYIHQQTIVQAKKKQEEGVSPKGTSPLKPFIKRKTTYKVNHPAKKPKVVTGSTIKETSPTTKLPPPPCPTKGKGLITTQGPISKKRPVLLREDSQYAISAVHHQAALIQHQGWWLRGLGQPYN